MARNKTYNIFLSHSSLDKGFTDKLHNLLELAGLNVWYDEKKLTPNSHILSDLPKYIGDSEAFIVIISKNSCNSSWVQDEYGYARGLYDKKELKAIIPVVIDDCDIPGFYNNYKWIDCKESMTPIAFFGILAALYGSSENMREEKDVYVSYSWRKEEQTLVNAVFRQLKRKQYRIIGDASNNSVYDEDDRIRRIMNTCGAYVGILPYRGDSNTSRYILDEISKAQECDLLGVLFADSRVENLEDSNYPVLKIDNIESIDETLLLNHINKLVVKRPKTPHIFYATNLDRRRQSINELIRNLAGVVTATRCILGEDINKGSLQQQIIDRIRSAYVMIADITGEEQCVNCEVEGKINKDRLFRFNTCIEAGIARGADTDLFIIAKEPRQAPPFMFRDIEVRHYVDDCSLLAIVHKILRGYRRSVL
ncbi:MAG: toll/interleukin-1 receptor domain-containing protein [Prevotellaceae bacterium]|nr:toll/interleukin-1 receptor domain-containing protein [Prevotellaceae bacterium]